MRNSEVAHLWVHGEDAEGSNFSAVGDRVFSYDAGYVVAQRYRVEGTEVILLNCYKHSPTTGRHIAHVRQATTHLTSFYAPYPDAGTDKRKHRENADYLKGEHLHYLKLAAKARTNVEFYMESGRHTAEQYNKYLKLFKIKRKPIDVAAIEPAYPSEAEKKAAKIRQQKRKEKQQKLPELWLNNDPKAPRVLYSLSFQYLRMKDPETVETSGGATFPVQDAKRAWRIIKRIYDTGVGYEMSPIGLNLKLGIYWVDRVCKNGTVIAGCHKITKQEIERFAAVIS